MSSSIDPKTVSETAHQEGGTTKGSESAQLQSQMTKERNAEQVDQHVKDKLDSGVTPTKHEANLAESREHRATGERPQSGSLPAQAKSAADKATTTEGHVEDHIKVKLDSGVPPTKEEARQAESHEHRATGNLPESGSVASKAQSAADKHANFEAEAKHVQEKLEHDPASITSGDATHTESLEHRALGYRPPKDSVSAEAKRVAAANEQGKDTTTSAAEAKFQEAVDIVAPKMQHEPEKVNEEDANLLHSADRRAHGTVEKGGITAQAQHLAAENKGDTKA